jgi:hypothetical protein
MDEARITVPITKIDPDRRIFGGWAYVAKNRDGQTVVDRSGDVVDTPQAWQELVDAFYEYALEVRVGDEMHENFGVSKLAEFFVSDEERWEQMGIPEGVLPKGVFVSYLALDDDLWAKIKSGDYRSLSIVGAGVREAL